MTPAFLFAMQAAGVVTDYLGTANQQKLGEYGLKLQEAGIEANIQQNRLEAEDASVEALKNLRKTMGTQLAIFGARGTNPSAGSAVSFLTESIGNYNQDERMKRMNMLGRENELKAGGLISRLNQSSANAKLWKGFASRTVNTFSSRSNDWKEIGKSFAGNS